MTTASVNTTSASTPTTTVDLKLEVVVIPVADVDRSRAFYASLGWRLDADFAFDNGFRIVQFTPPGSPASIQFGNRVTSAAPGSTNGIYLVVADIEAARNGLADKGIQVSAVFHPEAPGAQFTSSDTSGKAAGLAADDASYGSFATFSDPDGNSYLLQEVTTRLPGRVDASKTTFATVDDLTNALHRAAIAHGEHEKITGQYDEQWPIWYAEYMVAEQVGTDFPV
jgi:catechol 2,3-dioxygenase-like lactoylglutathione lyase family enzyme